MEILQIAAVRHCALLCDCWLSRALKDSTVSNTRSEQCLEKQRADDLPGAGCSRSVCVSFCCSVYPNIYESAWWGPAIRRCLPPRLEVDRCFTSGMRDGCRTSLGGMVARWTQEGKSQRSAASLVVFVSRLWHQRHAKKGWAILGILVSIHYKVNTGLRVLTSIPFTWNNIIIVTFAFS